MNYVNKCLQEDDHTACVSVYVRVSETLCMCVKCCRINYYGHTVKLPGMTFSKGNKAAVCI